MGNCCSIVLLQSQLLFVSTKYVAIRITVIGEGQCRTTHLPINSPTIHLTLRPNLAYLHWRRLCFKSIFFVLGSRLRRNVVAVHYMCYRMRLRRRLCFKSNFFVLGSRLRRNVVAVYYMGYRMRLSFEFCKFKQEGVSGIQKCPRIPRIWRHH